MVVAGFARFRRKRPRSNTLRSASAAGSRLAASAKGRRRQVRTFVARRKSRSMAGRSSPSCLQISAGHGSPTSRNCSNSSTATVLVSGNKVAVIWFSSEWKLRVQERRRTLIRFEDSAHAVLVVGGAAKVQEDASLALAPARNHRKDLASFSLGPLDSPAFERGQIHGLAMLVQGHNVPGGPAQEFQLRHVVLSHRGRRTYPARQRTNGLVRVNKNSVH